MFLPLGEGRREGSKEASLSRAAFVGVTGLFQRRVDGVGAVHLGSSEHSTWAFRGQAHPSWTTHVQGRNAKKLSFFPGFVGHGGSGGGNPPGTWKCGT